MGETFCACQNCHYDLTTRGSVFVKKKNKDHHSNKPKIMINYSLNFINFLGMIFIQLALTFLLSGSCGVQGCFLIIIHMQPFIFFITKFLLQRNITIKALNFHKFSFTNSQCRRKFAIISSLDAKDFMNTTVLETSLYCLTLHGTVVANS